MQQVKERAGADRQAMSLVGVGVQCVCVCGLEFSSDNSWRVKKMRKSQGGNECGETMTSTSGETRTEADEVRWYTEKQTLRMPD